MRFVTRLAVIALLTVLLGPLWDMFDPPDGQCIENSTSSPTSCQKENDRIGLSRTQRKSLCRANISAF